MPKSTTLFRLLLALPVVICVLSISPAAQAESIDDDIYRLGVSVSTDQVELKFGADRQMATGRHKVEVTTGLYMGYELYIQSANPDLAITTGADRIAASSDLASGEDLGDNTWGFQIAAPNKHWQGVSQTKKSIAIEESERPRSREFQVSFGARINGQLRAGQYQTQIEYTVTPRIPTTPVVTAMSTDRHQVDTAETLRLNGFNLNKVSGAYVDFNSNRQLDDNESCAIIDSSRSDSGFHCQLPASIPDNAQTPHGGKFDLRFIADGDSSSNGNDTGHQIAYYYKPGINQADVNATYDWRSGLGLAKQADATVGSVARGTNGHAYWWGEVPYTIDGVTMSSIPAPMLVDLHEEVLDVAATSGSYYALTAQGSIYAWGANNRYELGNDDVARGWRQDPADVRRFLTDKNALKSDERFIGVAGGGNHVLAVTNQGRVFSWGANGPVGSNDGRLGFDTNSDASHGHGITDAGRGYLDQAFASGQKFYRVAAGDNFSAALSTGGRLYVWGANDQGQLLSASNTSHQAVDITNQVGLTSGDSIADISASGKQLTIISANGTTYPYGGSANPGRNRPGDDALRYPLIPMMIGGQNLSHVSNLWLDYNQDGIYQASEQIQGWKFDSVNNKLAFWIQAMSDVSGSRTLHLDTPYADYGGWTSYGVLFRQLGSSPGRIHSVGELRSIVGDSTTPAEESAGNETSVANEEPVANDEAVSSEKTGAIDSADTKDAKDTEVDSNDHQKDNQPTEDSADATSNITTTDKLKGDELGAAAGGNPLQPVDSSTQGVSSNAASIDIKNGH